jgi:hypothetical protein
MSFYNGELVFDNVDGTWKGNDFKNVSMTSVTFRGALHAYVFLTHMNVDFDGAPNAYGPPEKEPLDLLEHAGWKTRYYGLVAIDPDETEEVAVPGQKGKKEKVLVKDLYNLKLDERFPDTHGRVPVVQQGGTYDGYYISITSRATRSTLGANKYQQSTYINSTKVAYGALSKNLQDQGVAFGNCGIAIRHDNGRKSQFVIMEGGHMAGPDIGAVGECSYRVFLEVGGSPKTAAQVYPNNTFATSFLIFPNSSAPTLSILGRADNADDLPMLMAYGEDAGYADRSGKSGKPLLDAWVAGGRTGARPRSYKNILSALRSAGFWPQIGDFPNRQDLEKVAGTA